MAIIYKATNIGDNPERGFAYIGQTLSTLEKRKLKHLGSVRRCTNYAFHQAIRKYGPESFEWRVLFVAERNMLGISETKSIIVYKTKMPYGYNMTNGGTGVNGYIPSEEAKRKNSESQKGEKSHCFGKRQSESTKRKNSEAHIGKKHTEAAKRKMSIVKTGKYSGENNPMNKYYFTCDDGKDYWKDFTIVNRININHKFKVKKSDIIIYKNITITRKLKDKRG